MTNSNIVCVGGALKPYNCIPIVSPVSTCALFSPTQRHGNLTISFVCMLFLFHRASFPDVLEMILPADGRKTVGEVFVGILKDLEKLRNFSVGIEGARVPLNLDTDTSALIGQKVVVKYLPGQCESTMDSRSQ